MPTVPFTFAFDVAAARRPSCEPSAPSETRGLLAEFVALGLLRRVGALAASALGAKEVDAVFRLA